MVDVPELVTPPDAERNGRVLAAECLMDEGFCAKCGKRVTFPTSKAQCDLSPNCGPFRLENAVPDDVLAHGQRGWEPARTGRERAGSGAALADDPSHPLG